VYGKKEYTQELSLNDTTERKIDVVINANLKDLEKKNNYSWLWLLSVLAVFTVLIYLKKLKKLK
jgi:hypothetical protein